MALIVVYPDEITWAEAGIDVEPESGDPTGTVTVSLGGQSEQNPITLKVTLQNPMAAHLGGQLLEIAKQLEKEPQT